MEIQLDERFRIETVDALSVCLKERKVNNNPKSKFYGKVRWEVAGYYDSLTGVLTAYLRKSSITLEGSNVEELLNSIASVQRIIDEFATKHKQGFKDSWHKVLKDEAAERKAKREKAKKDAENETL